MANTSEIFSKVLEAQMLQTTKIVEEQLDAEIQKLDQMDDDELELLKQRRLEALKKAQKQKQVTCSVVNNIIASPQLMFWFHSGHFSGLNSAITPTRKHKVRQTAPAQKHKCSCPEVEKSLSQMSVIPGLPVVVCFSTGLPLYLQFCLYTIHKFPTIAQIICLPDCCPPVAICLCAACKY